MVEVTTNTKVKTKDLTREERRRIRRLLRSADTADLQGETGAAINRILRAAEARMSDRVDNKPSKTPATARVRSNHFCTASSI